MCHDDRQRGTLGPSPTLTTVSQPNRYNLNGIVCQSVTQRPQSHSTVQGTTLAFLDLSAPPPVRHEPGGSFIETTRRVVGGDLDYPCSAEQAKSPRTDPLTLK